MGVKRLGYGLKNINFSPKTHFNRHSTLTLYFDEQIDDISWLMEDIMAALGEGQLTLLEKTPTYASCCNDIHQRAPVLDLLYNQEYNAITIRAYDHNLSSALQQLAEISKGDLQK